tara:strand:+ start:4241 stop:5467 length:1227 start_codon:yes stop_codon:yes gene_type:complete
MVSIWLRISWILFIFFSLFIFSCSKDTDNCQIDTYENAPRIEWFNSYSGSEEESHGHFILSCLDGGFLQIGETGFIPNSARIIVVKTDSQGDLEWKKEFAEGNHNLGNSAIETANGFLIAGGLNQNSAIIKLDKNNGNTLYKRIYNNGGSNAIEHIAMTANGILAVGYNNAQDELNTFFTEGQGYMMFLDSSGNKLSSININNYMAHAYRVIPYNNHFYISGLTEDANDFAIMKIDISGNILWNRDFGGLNSDHCFGLDINQNGAIFLTGHTLSGTANWDTYTMKIDTNGNQLWEQKKGNPRGFSPDFIHDEAWGIKATNDGGCIVVAGTGDEYQSYNATCMENSDNSNIWHVYLLKYGASGLLEWQKTYSGGSEIDWAGEDIDLTSDGGAIVAVDDGQMGFLKIEPF